jgi:hypothetical protein
MTIDRREFISSVAAGLTAVRAGWPRPEQMAGVTAQPLAAKAGSCASCAPRRRV